jgi:hypothetical protein
MFPLVRRLRELDADPNSVRVSYVKVAELQARAIPHFHALIRGRPGYRGRDSSDALCGSSPDIIRYYRRKRLG